VLVQNHPNPFGPGTVIEYGVAERGRVVLSIHDVTGRKVATLVDQEMEPGYRTACWDGADEDGSRVAPGVYLCTLEAAGRKETMKMVLAR
jgi:flagellar hook assembly protein FlgD